VEEKTPARALARSRAGDAVGTFMSLRAFAFRRIAGPPDRRIAEA
jgi:hypothetical protein